MSTAEPDVSELPGVTDVNATIDAEPVSRRIETIALQRATGYRLAADVLADRDYPPFDKSLMDGYAVRAVDITAGVRVFSDLGEVPAGAWPAKAVGPGQVVAIMTGAPMPTGADGVIPVEFVDTTAPRREGFVALTPVEKPSRFVAIKGAEVRQGQVVLAAGTKLNSAQLAVAATVGAASVCVFARPRVAVLGSGDEVVAIDVAAPGPGQIRNANNLLLSSLLTRLGCDVTDFGVVRDDPATVREAIGRGRGFDVLFVTGGMSMGRYDYVPRTLIDLGAVMKVTKLRIKPGKPFVFAKLDKTFVFGLPGNPVSAFVCTLRLAARLLDRLNGGPPEPAWRYGKLLEPLPSNGLREFYQPAILDGDTVRPLKWRGSADVYTLAMANALIVLDENAPATPAGAVVRVLEIPS
jgi:molybdopterin molybdotransferase